MFPEEKEGWKVLSYLKEITCRIRVVYGRTVESWDSVLLRGT